jgi:hypothetical protein
MCNECGVIVDTVPAAEAERVLLRMPMDEGVCSERCPHCGETISSWDPVPLTLSPADFADRKSKSTGRVQ